MNAQCTVTLLPTQIAFSCRPDEDLLAGMRRSGMTGIPVGCRGGGCGVCRIQVLDGEFEHARMSRAHVSERDEQAGVALACRVYPRRDLRIEATGRMRQGAGPGGMTAS